jgi:hypothetical protein
MENKPTESEAKMEIKLKAYRGQIQQNVPDAETRLVSSLQEASRTARQWIAENDLGGSNIGALKVYDGKKLVALVSYNGKVWTTEKDWQKRTVIYNPNEAILFQPEYVELNSQEIAS